MFFKTVVIQSFSIVFDCRKALEISKVPKLKMFEEILEILKSLQNSLNLDSLGNFASCLRGLENFESLATQSLQDLSHFNKSAFLFSNVASTVQLSFPRREVSPSQEAIAKHTRRTTTTRLR